MSKADKPRSTRVRRIQCAYTEIRYSCQHTVTEFQHLPTCTGRNGSQPGDRDWPLTWSRFWCENMAPLPDKLPAHLCSACEAKPKCTAMRIFYTCGHTVAAFRHLSPCNSPNELEAPEDWFCWQHYMSAYWCKYFDWRPDERREHVCGGCAAQSLADLRIHDRG